VILNTPNTLLFYSLCFLKHTFFTRFLLCGFPPSPLFTQELYTLFLFSVKPLLLCTLVVFHSTLFTQRLPTLFFYSVCKPRYFFSSILCVQKARLLFFFTLVLSHSTLFFFFYSSNKKHKKHTQEKLYPSFKSVSPKVRNKVCVSSFCCISFYKNLFFFVAFFIYLFPQQSPQKLTPEKQSKFRPANQCPVCSSLISFMFRFAILCCWSTGGKIQQNHRHYQNFPVLLVLCFPQGWVFHVGFCGFVWFCVLFSLFLLTVCLPLLDVFLLSALALLHVLSFFCCSC